MVVALNLFELEQLAKEKLPRTIHDYYSSGAWDEVTIRENCEAEQFKIQNVITNEELASVGS